MTTAQEAAARIREALTELDAVSGDEVPIRKYLEARKKLNAQAGPNALRALLAERDELAKDAARWRALRDGDDESVIDSIYPFSIWENTHWLKRGQALDKAVDSNLAALTNKD